LGRVRATGKGVGIKLYLGAAPRHSSSYPTTKTKAEITGKIRQELIEEMRKEVDQMQLEL